MKLITLSLLTLLLTPGTALAHEGHPHVGNEVFHHAMEAAAVVLLAAAAVLVWSRLRVRLKERRSQQTLKT